METLVLNATYEPIARVSWQRAISLLFSGKVEVVEEYDDRTVRSVTLELRMPSVVRFLRRLARRKPVIRFSRENVFARDRGRCQYCGHALPRHEATFDHVRPRSQGGTTNWDNVVIACLPCNQRKGGRTPEQARMKLLSRPVRPQHLPDGFRLTFGYEKGMPPSWKNWLRDVAYWHGSLDEDRRGQRAPARYVGRAMPTLHRSILLALVGVLAGCAGRRGTGTAREAMIGAPNPISHVELTISGLSQEDAERIERQFKSEGFLKNALLRSYVAGKAVYEMDVKGCECDLPERLAQIPHPGLRYEGRTTRVAYSAFDNEAPSINLVYPPVWKVVDEPDPYVLVEVPASDVAKVTINGVPAERFRGPIFRARVHFEDGPRALDVVAVDQAGNEGRLQRQLQVDTTPAAARAVYKVVLEGHVEPGTVLFADGREVPVDAKGHYRAEVRVQRRQATAELVALDPRGNKTIILRPLDEGREAPR